MTKAFKKLAFVHGLLWRQDWGYRFGLLLGPAPLLGIVLAGALWWAITVVGDGLSVPDQQLPGWAKPDGTAQWKSDPNEPALAKPFAELPPLTAAGTLAGYRPGWQVKLSPIEVDATMDVNVESTAFKGFTANGPGIDMAHILAEGPKSSLYVAVSNARFVVKTAGVYTLAIRLQRPAGLSANCLVRLAFAEHRISSDLNLSVVDDVSKTFNAVKFDLQPGLYRIAWAFGCWRDQTMTGPGQIVLLIRHPGEEALLPAREDDIVMTALENP